jgi:hypothetical protein
VERDKDHGIVRPLLFKVPMAEVQFVCISWPPVVEHDTLTLARYHCILPI